MVSGRLTFTAILIAIAALVGVFVLSGSFYTVDEGERGVLTRNGAVVGVADPGLGFKLPLIDGIRKITVRTEIFRDEQLQAYSKDQQTATMIISVNYHIIPTEVSNVYSRYGSAEGVAERLIRPRINEEIKTAFGQFTAVSAIQNRAGLNAAIFSALADAVKGPVIIEGVQLENIDFSDAYEQSIENRMQAEVEVQKLEQLRLQSEKQKQIAIIEAEAQSESQKKAADGQAYATREQAKAAAEATRLAGDAEAMAIKAKGEALRDNPSLIQLTTAERWNGVLPTTMIPGAAVPFLGLK